MTSVESARTSALVVLFRLSLFELRDAAHWVGSGGEGLLGGERGALSTLGFRFHGPRPWRRSNIDILITVSRVCLPPVTSDVYVRGERREVQVSPDESWRLQNLGHTQKRVLIDPGPQERNGTISDLQGLLPFPTGLGQGPWNLGQRSLGWSCALHE